MHTLTYFYYLFKAKSTLKKTQVHPKQNAFAFQTKRKYVLSKTQGRFILNVRAFQSKHKGVFQRIFTPLKIN